MESFPLQLTLENLFIYLMIYLEMSSKMVQIFVHMSIGPYLTGPYDVVVAPIICSQFLPGMEATSNSNNRALFIPDTFILVPIAY